MRRPAIHSTLALVLMGAVSTGCSATTAQNSQAAPRLVESETVAAVGGEISKDIDAILAAGGPSTPAATPVAAAAKSAPKKRTSKPTRKASKSRAAPSPVVAAAAPAPSGGGDVVELAARIAAAAGRDPIPVAPSPVAYAPTGAAQNPYAAVSDTRAFAPRNVAPPTGNYGGAGSLGPQTGAPVAQAAMAVPSAAPNTVPGGALLPQLHRGRPSMLPPVMPTGRVVQLTGPGYPPPGAAAPVPAPSADAPAKPKRKVKRF